MYKTNRFKYLVPILVNQVSLAYYFMIVRVNHKFDRIEQTACKLLCPT